MLSRLATRPLYRRLHVRYLRCRLRWYELDAALIREDMALGPERLALIGAATDELRRRIDRLERQP